MRLVRFKDSKFQFNRTDVDGVTIRERPWRFDGGAAEYCSVGAIQIFEQGTCTHAVDADERVAPGYVRIIDIDATRRISPDDIVSLRKNKVAIPSDEPAAHPGRDLLDFSGAPAECEAESVDRSNKSWSLRVVGKGAPDFSDKNIQIRFHDVTVGPDFLEEIVFGDDVRPACEQEAQQVERFRGKMDLLPVFQKLSGI